MLDSREPAIVTPTVISGEVLVALSFGTFDDAFASEEGSTPINIIGDRLHTEENYYIYVKCLSQ